MRLRRLLIVIVALVAICPVAAAAANTLVIGVRQFPTSLNPLIETTSAKTYVLSAVLRPLTAYDQDWRLQCLLCAVLPTVGNGKAHPSKTEGGGEGMAVTFGIRTGATWGDGTPVTTDDVVFTWNVGRHPKSGAAQGSFFKSIRSIEVHDARTFTLHFSTRTFDYNDASDFWLLPAHLERAVFEADPRAYRNRSTYAADPTNPGLYFGPYLISRYDPGARVVLTPNPHWWGAPPDFERVVIRTIGDTSALVANLLAGDIDMIAGELGISIEEARRLEEAHPGRFHILYKPGLLYEHLDLNLDNPVLADRRVRQALLYATDRRAIVETLFAGRSTVANSSVSPLDHVYSPEVPTYDYDPAKAKALLEAAGYHASGDGIRRDRQGKLLRLEVFTTAGHRTRETLLAAIQDQWRRVGVDLKITLQPARLFFGQTLLKRQFSGLALYAYTTSPEWVPRPVLYSSQIPSAANNWSGHNLTGFKDPEMDRLIDAVERQLDPAARLGLWADIQRVYAQQLPVLPLFFYSLPHVLPKWLEGVRPTGQEALSTLWIEDWRDARKPRKR